MNLPGVITAEPYLEHPVRLSNGHYARQLGITGKPPGTDLSRVLDLDLKPVVLPPDAAWRSATASPRSSTSTSATWCRSTLLDGDRRTVEAPVTQIIQSYIGLVVLHGHRRAGATGGHRSARLRRPRRARFGQASTISTPR